MYRRAILSLAVIFILLPLTASAAPLPHPETGQKIIQTTPAEPLPAPEVAEAAPIQETVPEPVQQAPVASGDAKTYALSIVGSQQFSCLDALWTKESGWRVDAYNPSGAYGIPQSLPASKMSAFGADYLTNPITQVNWGLDYIAGSYGTPCGAWAHSQAYNWY